MSLGLPRFVARRLAQAVPTVLGILLLNFFLLRLAPGDMADIMAGEAGVATPEYLAELRLRFGLDRPIIDQLWDYVSGVLTLDFGWSFRHARSVLSLILSRVAPTAVLLLVSTTIALTVGITLGVVAARHAGGWIDRLVESLALLCYATPLFWLSLMMIVLFSVQLGWLPSTGYMTLGSDLSPIGRALDILRHALMPATALALFYLALYARLTKAAMLEALAQDYIRTARAKGLSEWRVVFRHAVSNAILPTVTMTGVQVSNLLSGTVVVETVFAWPGFGRLAYEAVDARDFNLLLSILFVSSVLIILVNLLIDLLYAWFDPRIELA